MSNKKSICLIKKWAEWEFFFKFFFSKIYFAHVQIDYFMLIEFTKKKIKLLHHWEKNRNLNFMEFFLVDFIWSCIISINKKKLPNQIIPKLDKWWVK